MVGSALASSLVHEVGHQAAALLDLVPSLHRAIPSGARSNAPAWPYWRRWLSEIVADFWSVGKVGVTSTLGLMGVVSLPRAFVFRTNEDGVHPMPWIRVALSAAMGNALYPHPQWEHLTALWEALYPLSPLDDDRAALIATLRAGLPELVEWLAGHRPAALRGLSLREALGVDERQPTRLRALHRRWSTRPSSLREAAPSLVFAVVGQARADGAITPEEESRTLAELLRYWALRSTLDASALGASLGRAHRRLAAGAVREPRFPLRFTHSTLEVDDHGFRH